MDDLSRWIIAHFNEWVIKMINRFLIITNFNRWVIKSYHVCDIKMDTQNIFSKRILYLCTVELLRSSIRVISNSGTYIIERQKQNI